VLESTHMPLTTKLTQRLGIQHPIIQGGMHYVGYAPLAAAVSNAGAIGVITALTQPNAEALRSEIQKTRSLLRSPDTPIGVNLTVLPQLNSPDYPAIVQVLLDEKVARRSQSQSGSTHLLHVPTPLARSRRCRWSRLRDRQSAPSCGSCSRRERTPHSGPSPDPDPGPAARGGQSRRVHHPQVHHHPPAA